MTELAGTLWVAGGGALGAYCRFQISAWFAAWLGKGFPYGTLFVNVLGSFIMGLLVGAIKMNAVPFIPWHDFIGEGFLGALTTFSTFSMDTFAAFRDGQPGKAAENRSRWDTACLEPASSAVSPPSPPSRSIRLTSTIPAISCSQV